MTPLIVAALALRTVFLGAALLWLDFLLTGIVHLGGMPVEACLCLSTLGLITVAIGAWRNKKISTAISPASSLGDLVALLVFLFYAWRLFHPAYGGLVSVGGGDAGVHAHFQSRFAGEEPDAYQAFVAFSSVTYCLQLLFGLDSFESFRAAYYWMLLLFFWAVFQLVAVGAREREDKKRGAGKLVFVLFIALAYFPAERILLPLLHYLQADGFYPQLAGLMPLLAGWYVYTALEKPAARAWLLCGAIVLSRYSYGLNLPELFVAASFLAFLEIEPRGKHKELWLLAAVALFVPGIWACVQLLDIVAMPGGITRFDYSHAQRGTVLCVGALILLGIRDAERRENLRAYHFASAYLIAGLVCGGIYRSISPEGSYYPFKHAFYLSIVAVLAVCIGAASRLARREKPDMRLGIILLASFLGLWCFRSAFTPYYATYRERLTRPAVPKHIAAPADREAWKIIERTLEAKQLPFVGYIASSWPISSFMNAAFGYFGELPFFRTARLPDTGPGCVFWNSDAKSLEDYSAIPGGKVLRIVEELGRREGVERIGYTRREDGTLREMGIFCRK